MIDGINFIPRSRRELSRARQRLRMWCVICTAYALVLGVAAALAMSAGTESDPVLASKLTKLPREIERSERELAIARRQLAEVQGRLSAVRTITDQPDWTVLLGLVAEATGGDVILQTCRLEPVHPSAGSRGTPPIAAAAAQIRPETARPTPFTLHINGVAPSQFAVSQFVLRLEQLGLFRTVTLLKTSRELRDDGEAIAFRVEAMLGAENGAVRR